MVVASKDKTQGVHKMEVNYRATEVWGIISIETVERNLEHTHMEVSFEDGREKQTILASEVEKFRFNTYQAIMSQLLDMKLDDTLVEGRLVGNCGNVKDFKEHEWGIEVTLKEPFSAKEVEETPSLSVGGLSIRKINYLRALEFDVTGVTSVSVHITNYK